MCLPPLERNPEINPEPHAADACDGSHGDLHEGSPRTDDFHHHQLELNPNNLKPQ
jgi:hypothetical protein